MMARSDLSSQQSQPWQLGFESTGSTCNLMSNIEPQITSNCPSCATPKKREKGKLKLWTYCRAIQSVKGSNISGFTLCRYAQQLARLQGRTCSRSPVPSRYSCQMSKFAVVCQWQVHNVNTEGFISNLPGHHRNLSRLQTCPCTCRAI